MNLWPGSAISRKCKLKRRTACRQPLVIILFGHLHPRTPGVFTAVIMSVGCVSSSRPTIDTPPAMIYRFKGVSVTRNCGLHKPRANIGLINTIIRAYFPASPNETRRIWILVCIENSRLRIVLAYEDKCQRNIDIDFELSLYVNPTRDVANNLSKCHLFKNITRNQTCNFYKVTLNTINL